jgi:drug/metabolite transporter (DMT)-like permease
MPWLHWARKVLTVLLALYGIAIMVRPQLHGSRLGFIRGLGALLVIVYLFVLTDDLHLI